MKASFFTHNIRRLGILLGGGLISAGLAPGGVLAANDKPAATPQEAVHKICSGCHNGEIVTDTPKSYDDWKTTVQDMIDRGAKGSDDEFELVLEFLHENMTTIDVNHADTDELQIVLNVTPEVADRIIARRQDHKFKDLADLKTVAGVDPVFVSAKARMIFFQ